MPSGTLRDQDHLLQVAIDCLRAKRGMSKAAISRAIGYSGKNGPRDLGRFVALTAENMDDRREAFWKIYYAAFGASETSLLIEKTAAFNRQLSTQDVVETKALSLSGAESKQARPCSVCLCPARNSEALVKHVDNRHNSEHNATPLKFVTLAGVTELFKAATGKDSASLVDLLEASAHYQDNSINVRATDTPDTFNVSGDDPTQVNLFVKGLEAFWTAHKNGVTAVDASKDLEKYTSKMFPNFAEPVHDVWAVVVLLNPVHSDLDQRQSTTIKRFWKRFGEASGDIGKWVNHVVFLDLIPLLHSGKRNDLTAAEKDEDAVVKEAAAGKIFTKYAIARLLLYVAQANLAEGARFPVILCAGCTKWKRPAVHDFTDALSKIPNIKLYDCVYHPTANESRRIVPVLERFAHFSSVGDVGKDKEAEEGKKTEEEDEGYAESDDDDADDDELQQLKQTNQQYQALPKEVLDEQKRLLFESRHKQSIIAIAATATGKSSV